MKRSGIVIMWTHHLETLSQNTAHSLPTIMPFGSIRVVPIIGQTHPETPQCINTESNMLVVQRAWE